MEETIIATSVSQESGSFVGKERLKGSELLADVRIRFRPSRALLQHPRREFGATPLGVHIVELPDTAAHQPNRLRKLLPHSPIDGLEWYLSICPSEKR